MVHWIGPCRCIPACANLGSAIQPEIIDEVDEALRQRLVKYTADHNGMSPRYIWGCCSVSFDRAVDGADISCKPEWSDEERRKRIIRLWNRCCAGEFR